MRNLLVGHFVDTMGTAVRAMLALESGDLLAAGAHVRDVLNFAKAYGEHEAIVAGLFVYARLQGEMGNPTGAARLYGVASAHDGTSRVINRVVGRLPYREGLAAARAALGPEAFATAWADGRSMTNEQAVDEALQQLG